MSQTLIKTHRTMIDAGIIVGITLILIFLWDIINIKTLILFGIWTLAMLCDIFLHGYQQAYSLKSNEVKLQMLFFSAKTEKRFI